MEKAWNGTADVLSHDHDEDTFMKKIFDMVMEKILRNAADRDRKVVEFLHPEDLKSKLELEITRKGCPEENLVSLCERAIQFSVQTGHARFFNQLFSGLNQYGLAGAWLTEALNTSQYTYEVAPVFTLMENQVLSKMVKIVGFGETGDGIFCPGGSISNMYGLNLARYHRFPKVKTEGMHALPKACIFTSEQSHYSFKKGAAFLGFGVNNVRVVPCSPDGRMDPTVLEKMIGIAKMEGYVPLMVSATCGTTVVGAYDPLPEIADICREHAIWLHVDASWGGGVMLSSKHRHLCEGIDRCDSVAWNAHKMMGAQLQCCAFLTKRAGLLQQCHSASATYLFQQDKFYDVSYDTGDKSIQCGRKVDVFKLWLMWKAMGDQGLEDHINNLFDCTGYIIRKIKQTEGFRLVFSQQMCTNVCFWYIPPSMRNQEENDDWLLELGKVAPEIKRRMVMKGSMLIGYQPLGRYPNFFRLVLVNQIVEYGDMDFVLEEIDRLGRDL